MAKIIGPVKPAGGDEARKRQHTQPEQPAMGRSPISARRIGPVLPLVRRNKPAGSEGEPARPDYQGELFWTLLMAVILLSIINFCD